MNTHPYGIFARILNKTTCVLAFSTLLCATSRSQTIPEIEQFFIQPNEDAEIHVPASYQPGTKYVLSDYQGAVVATGQAEAKLGEWFVPVKLPAGYYDLDFPDANRHFGLVSIPKYEGKPDPFFGMDAALSWLAPVLQRESLIRILTRCGVGMVRERLGWPKLMREDGSWDWETGRAYDETRRLYAKYGIPLLELAHESPKSYIWNGLGKGPAPDDMVRSARDWKVIGQKWGPVWGAIEAWNEPDLQDAPADQYAYWVRTLRYALRNAGVKTPIGGGVFAYMSRPYMDLAAKNGLLDASDFISFHYYGDPVDMKRHVTEYRRWLKSFGHESMPLWLTESGSLWTGPQYSRPKLQQIQTAAMKISGNAIEARACGVQRIFPFVYVDYTEHKTGNFGMMDPMETPTRSMAAYATSIRLISNKPYVGDIKSEDGKNVCARVFAAENGEAVLVFVTGKVDPSDVIPLPFEPEKVYGADGRSLKTGSKVPVPDGLGFAVAPMKTVRPFLSTDSSTFNLSTMSAAATLNSAPVCPIILKAQLKNAPVSAETRGYRVEGAPGKMSIPIQVANLDHVEHEVTLEFRREGAPDLLGVIMGKIPAEGNAELSADVDFAAFPAGEETKMVEVLATSNVRGEISPVVLRFIFAQGLDEYLKQYTYQFALPMGEEHRWKQNVAPTGTMKFEHSPESQWGFSVEFSDKGDWVYPQFTIPQEAKLDRVTAVVVRGRVMKSALPRLITWNDQDKQSTCHDPLFPADGKWHVACVPLEGFVLNPYGVTDSKSALLGEQVKKISIGMNSREKQNQLEVSDLYLVGN
ncbi:MAG: glycosyl hydrolase [Chthoniobacteraceae bacterium]